MADSNNENHTPGGEPQAAGSSGGSRNSLSLVISGIAVLIAALALIANQIGQPAPRVDPIEALNNKLGQIEARIGDMESQLTNDKLDGVAMQLKRILLELEQLSLMADEGTRSRIDQARELLAPLSEPATKVKAEVDMQSTLAPQNQSAPSEESMPEVQTEPPASEPEATAPAPEAEGTASLAPTEGPDVGDVPAQEPAPATPQQPEPTPAEPVTPAKPVTHL